MDDFLCDPGHPLRENLDSRLRGNDNPSLLNNGRLGCHVYGFA